VRRSGEIKVVMATHHPRRGHDVLFFWGGASFFGNLFLNWLRKAEGAAQVSAPLWCPALSSRRQATKILHHSNSSETLFCSVNNMACGSGRGARAIVATRRRKKHELTTRTQTSTLSNAHAWYSGSGHGDHMKDLSQSRSYKSGKVYVSTIDF